MSSSHPRRTASVLRIALVRAGRVVEERLLAPGEPLLVGPTERATFIVEALPNTVTLFSWDARSRAPTLHLSHGMRARLARTGSTSDVAPDVESVTLDDAARGRVRIGEASILFELVEAREPRRPRFPKELRARPFESFDVRTTVIAAFSFLFHFGAVGSAYGADLVDASVEDDGLRVAHAVSLLGSLPPLPPIETPEDRAAPDAPPAHAPPSAVPTTPKSPAHPTNEARGSARAPEPGRASDARAAQIAKELASLDGAMLESIGATNDTAIGRVLSRGDAASTLLDGTATSAAGTSLGLPGFAGAGGMAGVVRPGEASHGLSDLARVEREKTSEASHGASPTVKPPRVTGSPEVAVGRIADAGRVVAGLRGQLRACYKHELDLNPTAQGTVRVTLSVGSNGEIQSAQIAASGSLSSTMVACVSRVAKGAQFAAPEGGTALVNAPFSFFPQ